MRAQLFSIPLHQALYDLDAARPVGGEAIDSGGWEYTMLLVVCQVCYKKVEMLN